MATSDSHQEWTDSELGAAIDAYLEMLELEKLGTPFNKAEVNRQLRSGILANRSKASIEYRMQNISATLDEFCLPRIEGYAPAKNIGTGVKDRIGSLLATKGVVLLEDYSPTSDEGALNTRFAELSKRKLTGTPRGNAHPPQSSNSTHVFVRDPLVKAWVLQFANGCCDGCSQNAPFTTPDGMPFLEVHHVHPLAEGGPDQVSNAVALCPNCHRRCHLSVDRKEFTSSLYERIKRLAVIS